MAMQSYNPSRFPHASIKYPLHNLSKSWLYHLNLILSKYKERVTSISTQAHTFETLRLAMKMVSSFQETSYKMTKKVIKQILEEVTNYDRQQIMIDKIYTK